MSKQKLIASQKRVNLFLCFCVRRALNFILKIVTCIASKIIPGTTDRIKGTRFSCYTHTHTQRALPGALRRGKIWDPLDQLRLKRGPGLRRQCTRPPRFPGARNSALVSGFWGPCSLTPSLPLRVPRATFSTTLPALWPSKKKD